MKFSRILIIIQLLLIVLLSVLMVLTENKHTDYVAIPVELCHPAKIERILWTAKIEAQNSDLSKATEQIDNDRERLIRNFSAKGLKVDEMSFLPIESFSVFGDSTIKGFHLVQKIAINSTEIHRVRKIITESSDLLRFRVQFSADEPSYELTNFRAWLTQLLPVLVAEGKAIAQYNKSLLNGKKIHFQALRIKPIFSDRFEICNTDSPLGSSQSDSLLVNVRAYIEFVLR